MPPHTGNALPFAREQEGLDDCTKLRVLYLYENQIGAIENLALPTVTHLNLQSNVIRRMEHMMSLHALEKL